MVLRAMGGRWTTCRMQCLCYTFFIVALEIHGCLSLNPEGLALFQFRAKLEFDPYGTLANWNPDDSDPCMWSGIECVDGNVVVLDLSGHDLEGVLAPELGNLSYMRFLDLSRNHLSGNIPRSLGQLKSLEVLDVRDNNLSGPVPAELGKLRSLKRLLLFNNRFEGSMPVEIEKLRLLTDSQLDSIFITADAAGIGCSNRKFGHCIQQSASKQHKKSDSSRTPSKRSIPHYLNLLPQFTYGSELPQSHADDGYNNLTDPPEQQRIIQNTYEEVNNVRRILVEQTTNLVSLPPPNTVALPPLLEPAASLPSRSSGSFPAVPKLPPPPLPSPPVGQEDKPPDTDHHPGHSADSLALIIGISVVLIVLIILAIMLIMSRSKAVKTIVPWKTGLSGQLQKAFVTGVPKLNRSELETACEDFSNIITTHDGAATLYKGTLSSGVEIVVASTVIASKSDWSRRAEVAFRKKIDSLSRVNHKNFVNLLGYCEEEKPFTRMMVFEYAPNGNLYEHLHVEECEHLDWDARMRIIMGTAYCLLYMHELNPPMPVSNLTSKDIVLTDDYAAKICDVAFWEKLVTKSNKTPAPAENDSVCLLPPLPDVETNTYDFGLLLLETISGKNPHTKEHEDILNWGSEYLKDKKTEKLVDPTLESVKEKELEVVCEVIEMCTQQEARKRPTMKETIQLLRQVLDISPEAATPRLSPLWWAELEILSQEAA